MVIPGVSLYKDDVTCENANPFVVTPEGLSSIKLFPYIPELLYAVGPPLVCVGFNPVIESLIVPLKDHKRLGCTFDVKLDVFVATYVGDRVNVALGGIPWDW
jgi:hypothetical protein